MEKLNFYTVDLSYVDYLKDAENKRRGFSRVPNMAYGDKRKPKFLCGVVLQVGGKDYYVPVTSYTQKKPDNFLIRAANGQVTSSLRFNYMFPVPKELVSERTIANEPIAHIGHCLRRSFNTASRTKRRYAAWQRGHTSVSC